MSSASLLEYELIQTGRIDVNNIFSDGSTALIIATGDEDACNIDCINYLLLNGAHVNYQNRNNGNEFALFNASKYGYYAAVELLLNHGAHVNLYTLNGYTALHVGCRTRQKEVVKILVEHNADVNCETDRLATPLILAIIECSSIREEVASSTSIVKMLLECNADVNHKGADGKTPLHVAIEFRVIDVVEVLLDFGADLNIKDDFRRTAISYAYQKVSFDIVELIRNEEDSRLRRQKYNFMFNSWIHMRLSAPTSPFTTKGVRRAFRRDSGSDVKRKRRR